MFVPTQMLLITHINFPRKYCKDSFVPGELISCIRPSPHLELTIYIKLQTSPVPSRFQLLQQPQLLPYCETQSPFSKEIHSQNFSAANLFITPFIFSNLSIISLKVPPLKTNSLIKAVITLNFVSAPEAQKKQQQKNIHLKLHYYEA